MWNCECEVGRGGGQKRRCSIMTLTNHGSHDLSVLLLQLKYGLKTPGLPAKDRFSLFFRSKQSVLASLPPHTSRTRPLLPVRDCTLEHGNKITID